MAITRSIHCAKPPAWHKGRLNPKRQMNAEMMKRRSFGGERTVNALRVGFVPLTDCAPFVIAKELGLFRKFGLTVALSRELGWATIRDKIIYRELDAAHAV